MTVVLVILNVFFISFFVYSDTTINLLSVSEKILLKKDFAIPVWYVTISWTVSIFGIFKLSGIKFLWFAKGNQIAAILYFCIIFL